MNDPYILIKTTALYAIPELSQNPCNCFSDAAQQNKCHHLNIVFDPLFFDTFWREAVPMNFIFA